MVYDLAMNDVAEKFWLESESAELYEKYLVPGWFNALTAITMDYVGDLKGKSVLDIATGTGIVPRFAAKKIGKNGKIVGIDINKGMLAVAAHLSIPHTELLFGDATKLEFDDELFDVVTCSQGFQFFPDRPAAAKEMYRVLKPGGRAVLATWSSLPENPAHEILVAMIEKYYGVEASQFLEPPFAYTDKISMHDTFESAGFKNVHVKTHGITSSFMNPMDFVTAMVGATPAAMAVKPESKEYPAFSKEIASTLKEKYTHGKGIKFPMHSTFIVADK